MAFFVVKKIPVSHPGMSREGRWIESSCPDTAEGHQVKLMAFFVVKIQNPD